MDLSSVRSDRLKRAFNNLPTAARQDIANNDQMVLKADPYYSKGRISCQTITSAGSPAASTLVFSKQDSILFNYAKGDAMNGAGFPSGAPYDKAVDADTNLYSKGETNGSEYVFIDGISMILTPNTDWEVLRRLLPHIYIGMNVSGIDNFVRFGNPIWLGGGGGVSGGGDSRLLIPRLDDYRAVGVGFPSLGLPSVNDVKQLPDPIVWGPKGKVDSSISMRVSLQRDITIVTAPTRTDATASDRVVTYTPPAAQSAFSDVDGTYFEFYLLFQCVQVGPRSNLR